MTVAADSFKESIQGVATNPPAVSGLPFQYLAEGLANLLETAQREIESDREAAKASLVAASHILQAEIKRCSGANVSARQTVIGFGVVVFWGWGGAIGSAFPCFWQSERC